MQNVQNHVQKFGLKVTFATFSNFVKTLQLRRVHATNVYMYIGVGTLSVACGNFMVPLGLLCFLETFKAVLEILIYFKKHFKILKKYLIIF